MVDICDVHGHFLPGMDDGCKTVEEALEMLSYSYRQGVHRMVATPHYYPVESIEEFLRRRQAAYDRLMAKAAGREDLPTICLGAEVAYRPGIGYLSDIQKLCIGNSRYLLLELPFTKWNRELLRDVRNLCAAAGVTPILAHIERYLQTDQKELLEQLLSMDVLVQMNAGCLLRLDSRRQGCRLLKNGIVQLLGSDCHNMTSRRPNLGKAVAYLEKKAMGEALDRIAALSGAIFETDKNSQ